MRMLFGIKARTALAAFLVLSLLAVPAAGQLNWIVENWGDPIWGSGSGANQTFWEPMNTVPILGPVSFVDLDPNNPYFASSGAYDRVFRSTHFWAELWLANNFTPVVPRQVDVELWTGDWQLPVTFVASASATVNNAPPAQKYVFDFGTIDLYATTYTIILKIIYTGPLGDTHIYWANASYPTGLYSDAPVPVDPSTWGRIKSLYR
jgi:hypothetical protein